VRVLDIPKASLYVGRPPGHLVEPSGGGPVTPKI
jgi:hypothetical protein